jgi:hypothetical protein
MNVLLNRNLNFGMMDNSFNKTKFENPSEEQAPSPENINKRQNTYTNLFDGRISG